MAVNKIEEEDKSRRAVLERAAQALAILQPQEDLSSDEIQLIRSVNTSAQKALNQTDYPSPGVQDKLTNVVSIAKPPVAQKVERSVSHIISKQAVRSPIDLFTKKNPSNDSKIATQQLGSNLLTKAKEISVTEKLSQDNTPDLSALNPVELLEESHASETIVGDNLQELSQANNDLSKAIRKKQFPNVAKEILSLGLLMEARKTEELERYKLEGDKHRDQIQKLLNLSAHLESDPPIHNLRLAILDKLSIHDREAMELCIREVFPNESFDITNITKDQLAGAKVRINDIMAEHKTAMTNLLTTKISVVIHNLQMMTQVLQNALRLDERLNGTIISHTGGR